MVCEKCGQEFDTADSRCFERWPRDVRERCLGVDGAYGHNAEKWKIAVCVSDLMEELTLNSNGMMFLEKAYSAVLAKRWQRNLRAYRAAAARHHALVKSGRFPALNSLAPDLEARTPKYSKFGDLPFGDTFESPSTAQLSQKWHASVRINRWMRRRQLYSVKSGDCLAKNSAKKITRIIIIDTFWRSMLWSCSLCSAFWCHCGHSGGSVVTLRSLLSL